MVNEDAKREAMERRFRGLKNMANALVPGGRIYLVPADVKAVKELVDGIPELEIAAHDPRTDCMTLIKR